MSSPIWQVRAANLSDADLLADIATAVSPPGTRHTASQLRWSIQQANGRFWVICQQQTPVGYAFLQPLPGLPGLYELAGGIVPASQRQGAGSYLWHQLKKAVQGTAVRQITVTLPDLASPAARFLRHHQFALEHEEWTMALANLAAILTDTMANPSQLQRVGRQTAVQTLPPLYHRCFRHTPWFQPYTAAEVAATWEADDQLYYLVENGDAIGLIWFHFPQRDAAEIEPMGIVPEKQGKGYGRLLLSTALHQLQSQEIISVSLGVWSTNRPAINLYRSLGFQYKTSSYSLTYRFNPT